MLSGAPDKNPSGQPLQPGEDRRTLEGPVSPPRQLGRGLSSLPGQGPTGPCCAEGAMPLEHLGCTGQGGQPYAQGVSMDLGQRGH